MSTPIVVVGAGGFGREVVDVINAMNESVMSTGHEPSWDLLGVVDDAITDENRDRLERRSIRHLGSVDEFLQFGDPHAAYVVGIGAPAIRRQIAERFDSARRPAATLIHPSVSFGANVEVSPGSVICAGARITTNITIGRHVHVNLNATIGHDTTIGDFVSLNPLASISGDCTLEDDVLVGVAGVLLNGVRVGEGATVGGSACVVRDVAPGTTVVGVPAKPRAAR